MALHKLNGNSFDRTELILDIRCIVSYVQYNPPDMLYENIAYKSILTILVWQREFSGTAITTSATKFYNFPSLQWFPNLCKNILFPSLIIWALCKLVRIEQQILYSTNISYTLYTKYKLNNTAFINYTPLLEIVEQVLHNTIDKRQSIYFALKEKIITWLPLLMFPLGTNYTHYRWSSWISSHKRGEQNSLLEETMHFA